MLARLAVNEPPRQERRHHRVELLASVQLGTSAEALILTVRNLSLGGVFVFNDGHDLAAFAVGSTHELTIFTPGDLAHELVVRGAVIRHEADGMALEWPEDGTSGMRIAALIGGAAPSEG